MLPIFFFIFLTTGCENTSAVVDVITFQPSDYDVKFFTNHSKDNIYNAYIDAILELKAKYPSEFKAIEEKEEDINDLEHTINENIPTLIIQKNGKTITELSGKKPRSEIIRELEKTISDVD